MKDMLNVCYGVKKTTDKGSASVMVLDNESKRSYMLKTPEMMTWGIQDYVDEHGKSNEKYTLSLAFSQNGSEQEIEFLKRLKELENKILDDAVLNSELWWGEPMSKEVLKHTYFPFLKYSKVKGTKRNDESKPPSLRAKVPYYNGAWGDSFVIFSDKKDRLFPSDSGLTPVDLIPSRSRVACVLQFQSIWFGGKGWGVTIKAVQAVVRPQNRYNINDVCQIELDENKEEIEKSKKTETYDSDEEVSAPVPVQVPTPVQVPAPVQEEAVVQAPVKKKIVKKASA